MDGFTGLDVIRAKREIENFDVLFQKVYQGLHDETYSFFYELTKKWASPNAKAFSEKHGYLFGNLLHKINISRKHIINGAVSAAITLAHANGMEFYYETETITEAERNDTLAQPYPICKDNIDGAVGMATENVRILADLFNRKMNAYIKEINNLPKTISFYSPDGSLVNAYETSIDKFANDYTSELNSSMSDLIKLMGEEENNIRMAKNEAQSILEEKAV